MENTKTITVGNWTVAENALEGLSLDEAKQKFNYVDSRKVEIAHKKANPKQTGRKKKKSEPSE